jgi:hypothetical protein
MTGWDRRTSAGDQGAGSAVVVFYSFLPSSSGLAPATFSALGARIQELRHWTGRQKAVPLNNLPGRFSRHVGLVNGRGIVLIDFFNDFQRRSLVTGHVQGRIASLVRVLDALGTRPQEELDNLQVLGVMPQSHGERSATVAAIFHAKDFRSSSHEKLEKSHVRLVLGLMKERQIERELIGFMALSGVAKGTGFLDLGGGPRDLILASDGHGISSQNVHHNGFEIRVHVSPATDRVELRGRRRRDTELGETTLEGKGGGETFLRTASFVLLGDTLDFLDGDDFGHVIVVDGMHGVRLLSRNTTRSGEWWRHA